MIRAGECNCKNCDMRTKYGDCHEICPSYLEFVKRKAQERRKKLDVAYVAANNGWSYQRSKRK